MSIRGGKSWIRREAKPAASLPRRKIFLWSLAICLIVGITNLGAPLEDYLQDVRNHIRLKPASGSVVIVAIDDKSIKELSHWPWPREYHARMITNLDLLGAKKIYFDVDFSSPSEPAQDRLFDAALRRLGEKVTLAGQFEFDPLSGRQSGIFTTPAVGSGNGLASITVHYNYRGLVRRLPYSADTARGTVPSLASAIAERGDLPKGSFRTDFAIDPHSVPIVSASKVLHGLVSDDFFRGKNVVIGATSRQLGDISFVPPYGKIPSVYLHVLGAETLKSGAPRDISWAVPFGLCALMLAASLASQKTWLTFAMIGFASLVLLIGPLWLDSRLVAVSVTPSLLLLASAGTAWSWTIYKLASRRTNSLSELPNLNALREERGGAEQPLIVARVRNYAEITSALPPEEETTLVEQIAKRLTVARPTAQLFHGDGGVFVSFADAAWTEEIDGHLAALYELFRSPMRVNGNPIDLTISFGVDTDYQRSLPNRLGSALAAAEEAASEGRKWQKYGPTHLEETKWKLSVLSQLDAAIDAGDLWLAYQPKLDLSTRDVIGAEALIRWTHPDKGEITPLDFIPAAEQNDRIEKLTAFVLDRAVRAAAAINRRGVAFVIAVNISARVINQPGLPRLVEAVLARHGLDPCCLTLEVTETAALATDLAGLKPMMELRRMGVEISIDDYGTGLSTLEYMKKVPATEIKIDKSFIQTLLENHSDRLMVSSTIQLAHSMGRTVVAEGVEDRATLETLATMGCDLAQGYFIGKPMKYHELIKQFQSDSKNGAAITR